MSSGTVAHDPSASDYDPTTGAPPQLRWGGERKERRYANAPRSRGRCPIGVRLRRILILRACDFFVSRFWAIDEVAAANFSVVLSKARFTAP